MADGGHVFRQFGFFVLVLAQLDIEGNILTKIQSNPTSDLGGDVITSMSVGNFTKPEPGTNRPNLSTDRNCFL